MKKTTLILLTLLLVTFAAAALADIWYCPQCGRENDGNFCPVDRYANPLTGSAGSSIEAVTITGSVAEEWGLATARLATRSGPTTEFTEPGTFNVKDTYVKIVSISYDVNGVPWVQCEIPTKKGIVRAYTGLKRFDTSTFNLANVPDEATYYTYTTQLNAPYELRSGPGLDYALMSGFKISSGRTIRVITTEGDWAQIQFPTSNNAPCRGWVPVSYLK